MDHIFTLTSLYSLLGVTAIAGVAAAASITLLPKDATKMDRWTFVWVVRNRILSNTSPRLDFQIFDALIHFCYEGSWLYYSTFGRQVNTSVGPLAQMCTLSTLCPTLSF